MAPKRKFAELSELEHCYNTRSKSRFQPELRNNTRSRGVVHVKELSKKQGKTQCKCPPGYGYRKREDGLLDMTWIPEPLQKM